MTAFVQKLLAGLIFLAATLVPFAQAQQPDFDPWDDSIPREKVEKYYQEQKNEYDNTSKETQDGISRRVQLGPFLKGLRQHLTERGTKFDGDRNVPGLAPAPTKGATKKADAPKTGDDGGNKPVIADNGFRFGGLKYGGRLPEGIGREPGGIGASWFIVCLDIDIKKTADGYEGTIRDSKLLTYAHTFMDPKTVEGLKTAVHELEHISQYKHAWGTSRELLTNGFKVTGKDMKAVQDAAKAVVDSWHGHDNGFNVHFTGKGMTRGVKQAYEQATGNSSSEEHIPVELAPKTEEAKFENEFKGNPEGAKAEADKRSTGLTTADPPGDVKPTHTAGKGTVRLKLRLFEDGKQVAMLDPGILGEPKKPTEQAYAVSWEDPNVCIASIFTVGENLFTEAPNSGLISYVPPVDEGQGNSNGIYDGKIPECTPTSGLTYTPPATGTPQTPSNGTPGQPASTPEVKDEPRTTTRTPDIETPSETPEQTAETPDLGLAKAQETLIALVLTDEATGSAIEGALVKSLTSEPGLPTGGKPDPTLTDTANFAGDVQGAGLDESGELLLSLADGDGDGDSEISLIEVEDSGQDQANATGKEEKPAATIKKTVKLGKQQPQLVVATQGLQAGLPMSLVPKGAKICVKRSFSIGDKRVHVVSLPQKYADDFTRNTSGWVETIFVEPDPCRDKEENADPLYDSSGLWGQLFDNQWAIKKVGFDKKMVDRLAKSSPASSPVIVAVIDTGLDWYHPDIPQGSIWQNPGEIQGNGFDDDQNGYVDDLVGWNFVRDYNKPWDSDGHGTFVSGVIAAGVGNGVGIAGISPAVRIMPLKALDAFGRGHASMVAEAISYAANGGARIINLSLAGRGITKVEQLAVDYARSKDVLIVVAAGNEGKPVAEFSPAGIPGVITVTATDRKDKRAGFSNWGPLVDIAAPGIDVLSLRARNTDLLSFIRGVKYKRGEGILGEDRAYYRASGTSFAAPIVSGTLSLLLAQNPTLTAQQASRMILHSARDIETAGIDNYTGYGLLDVKAAMKADPAYFNEARISGVKVVRKDGKTFLRVLGSTAADQFEHAAIRIGKGTQPDKWFEIKKKLVKPVVEGQLIDLPAGVFKGAKQWTIRLITRHKDGSERLSQFSLKLG